MREKKIGLLFLLIILTTLLGLSLSLIDIPGFFDGKSQLNLTMIILSVCISYFIAIVVFLLDFSDRSHMNLVFALCASIFAGCLILFNSELFLGMTSFFIYYFFLSYIYHQCFKRAELFIRFSPNEIFISSARSGFTILILLMACIAFFQTKDLLTNNHLLTQQFVRLIIKPVTPIINKQLSQQINNQIEPMLKNKSVPIDRDDAIRLVLLESLKNFDQAKTQELLGVAPSQIPIQKALVSNSGEIDLGPVIEELLTNIAGNLNSRLGVMVRLAPLAISVIVFVLLQSILWPFGLIARAITPLIFWGLFKSGFIKKTQLNQEIDKT